MHSLHNTPPTYRHGHGRHHLLPDNVYANTNGQFLLRPASFSTSQPAEDIHGVPHDGNAGNSSMRPRRIRPDHKGHNALCFDGGGCRGYASLLTTRNILRRIEPDPNKLVYPYIHYDLICGTSTGGLIAILLGVLHLDIDAAIRVYEAFGKTVFGTHWSKLRYVLQDERFNSKLLKRAVLEILDKYGEGRTLMEDPNYDRGCKCFVTVAHMNQDKAQILLVRSYPPPRGTDSIPNGHHLLNSSKDA